MAGLNENVGGLYRRSYGYKKDSQKRDHQTPIMSNTRVIATAIVGAFLATALPVLAQIAPGDSGAGVQRGVQQLNQSGQVGTLTVFNGGGSSRVVLSIQGEPPGRIEAAHIHRGKGCGPGQIDPAPVYPLNNVIRGRSATTVNASEDKLLSGNYVIIIHAGPMPNEEPGMMGKPMSSMKGMATSQAAEKYVACGYLYRS
jgi:Cu/Zn superoxide dismutase